MRSECCSRRDGITCVDCPEDIRQGDPLPVVNGEWQISFRKFDSEVAILLTLPNGAQQAAQAPVSLRSAAEHERTLKRLRNNLVDWARAKHGYDVRGGLLGVLAVDTSQRP